MQLGILRFPIQVTKLKEENQKQKIELEFTREEKKQSSLREDEEEKNARDRVLSQRLELPGVIWCY